MQGEKLLASMTGLHCNGPNGYHIKPIEMVFLYLTASQVLTRVVGLPWRVIVITSVNWHS